MEINKAAGIFKHPDFNIEGRKTWADLGCGTGTFTMALAGLVSPGSIIYAIDSNESALKKIPALYGNAVIEKRAGNFVTNQMTFPLVDGILMANSLHYVEDKSSFILKMKKNLTEQGCFLVVEYDTDIANNWVPYPQKFISLKALFLDAGFSAVHKLNEIPSVYRQGKMYAAIIEK